MIFCEHKNLYGFEGEVPEASYTIPFGEADIVREGKSVSIVTYGLMVHRALEAAAALAKEGIEAEIVDLRTLSPLDIDTVIESVEKTGHLVCVDEANPRCSIAADVSAQVVQGAFGALKRPDPDGHRAAHAGAVLAGAGGPLHPQRGADRRGGQASARRRTPLMAAITPIVMPKWGLSMEEGTVVSWLVEEGAEITVGMPILEVESDKIANAVEAPDPGLLRRRLAAAGDLLPVKALLGVMAPAEVSEAEIDAYVAGYVVPAAAEGEDDEAGPAFLFTEVDGIRVRYARRGDAASAQVPVLFLHGFGGDLDNWLFNLDAVAAAAPVIALDLPGPRPVRRAAAGQRCAGRPGELRAALPGRDRRRARACRRPFDGRGDRGADGAGRAAARGLAGADRQRRPGAGDQRRLHRRLRRRGDAARAEARDRATVRRPGPGQPPDARRPAEVQAPRRRFAGADAAGWRAVRRWPASRAAGGAAGRRQDAGDAGVGPRRPHHPGRPCRPRAGRRQGAGAGGRRPHGDDGEGRRGQCADRGSGEGLRHPREPARVRLRQRA